MQKILLSLFAIVVVGASNSIGAVESNVPSSTPSAHPLPGVPGENGPWRHLLRTTLQRLLAFRNETPLSPEQRKQVRDILEKHRDEIHAQLAAGREARAALHRTITEGDNAEAAAAHVGENAHTGALLYAKLAREIRPVLTAEQRERLDSTFELFQAEVGKMVTAQ